MIMVKKHSSIKRKHKKEYLPTIIGVVVGIILLGLLSYGVYYLVATPKVDLSEYNGFAFEHRSNGKQEFWITHVQLEGQVYEAPFFYHPTEVEMFAYDDRVTNYFLTIPVQKIILAVHPDAGAMPVQAGINIGRITGKFYGIPTASALYVPANETYENVGNLSKVHCGDATKSQPIVWLNNKTTEPSVTLREAEDEQFCIYVSGEGEQIIAAADLMAYKLLGIIK